MSDSWRLRKLLPGFAQRYSKFKVLRTSTMKSEPGRSTVTTSTPVGASGSAFKSGGAPAVRSGSGDAAFAAAGWTTSAAVPAAAARRKSRRFTETFLGFRTGAPPDLRPRDYSDT